MAHAWGHRQGGQYPSPVQRPSALDGAGNRCRRGIGAAAPCRRRIRSAAFRAGDLGIRCRADSRQADRVADRVPPVRWLPGPVPGRKLRSCGPDSRGGARGASQGADQRSGAGRQLRIHRSSTGTQSAPAAGLCLGLGWTHQFLHGADDPPARSILWTRSARAAPVTPCASAISVSVRRHGHCCPPAQGCNAADAAVRGAEPMDLSFLAAAPFQACPHKRGASFAVGTP